MSTNMLTIGAFRRIEYFRYMLKVIQHIFMIPLLLSTIISIRSIRFKWPLTYRMFSILLILISFVEGFEILWKYYLYNAGNRHFSNSNLWIYNFFLIPQYLLYMAVFYQAITSGVIRKTIIVLGLVFVSFSIVNWVYFQSIYSVNSYSLLLASGIIIFLTVSYFEQLRKSKTIISLYSHPMVWISLGAFIFHAANIPYLISLNYLIRNNVSLAIALFYIFLGLNCIMYLFYIKAFLCRPLPPKY